MRTALAFLMLLLAAGAAAAQFGSPSVETITVSPRLPTAIAILRVSVTGLGICGASAHPEFYPPEISGNRITLRLSSHHNCSPPGLAPFTAEFLLSPLPAGTWTVGVIIDEEAPVEKTVEVDPAATPILYLQDQKFQVRVEWSTADGALHGNGYAVPLSKESGMFWFFEGSNPEILVKILDGRPVNGHWWVFISSNTNLRFTVRVAQLTDFGAPPPSGQEKTYVSPAGANKNFIDTETFRDN
ncbi:MAG TPA: hypothetical protein VLT87_18830 [Thermoanaerobaculia bacterium]|nr:hypothetical protein [Thermoanaerobaculia bacterium]